MSYYMCLLFNVFRLLFADIYMFVMIFYALAIL